MDMSTPSLDVTDVTGPCSGVKRFLLALAAISSVTAPAASQNPPELDSFVTAVMREFKVPGVAVSIVKDGQVVVARGYGVRSIDQPARVDEHTRFGIASNTKLFTATALAMLAEQGKLALDSPVIRYLPWFQMSDPEVTRQITVRDLLVHRSGLGLGAGDLLWWPQTSFSRTDLVRRLRYVRLAKPFRKEYAYDNVLYTVAGEVIQAVSSNVWEQFVDQEILRRIGMSDSRLQHSNAADSGNVARTHGIVDGAVRRITQMTGNNTNPAGGIN
ncbi:MAG TPA: serine hydrolase domain-containing protein, partial [Gemmatimonadaceae bacterium]|nr:serine hydrolase domain-containing protein [Gemmatimonadaceae bacterium]